MYLDTYKKEECFGCEGCAQICPKKAITMHEDIEGFRYPIVDESLCINCGLCRKVCPHSNVPILSDNQNYAFGGYSKRDKIRFESTSGGAFTEIVEAWCKDNYVIFGAVASGLDVTHKYITDKKDLYLFRKSKYSQSVMGDSFVAAKKFLNEGKNVLFSGTPCQIAGLLSFLKYKKYMNLLTVEVICEGVPSPLYIRKYNDYLFSKHRAQIENLDYRFTGKSCLSNGKWDFQIMKILLTDKHEIKKDRWLNPFWNIWLNHLMSRPSCYKCPFANTKRYADISLGDLWGVHLYCPELYGKNGGASLIVANTKKGKLAVENAQPNMYGHELDFAEALKYQSPMRNHISENPNRERFMQDLSGNKRYPEIIKEWYHKPSIKILWQKYIWGNRQKILLWNLRNRQEGH